MTTHMIINTHETKFLLNPMCRHGLLEQTCSFCQGYRPTERLNGTARNAVPSLKMQESILDLASYSPWTMLKETE